VASTIAYLLLYVVLRGVWPATVANGVALLTTAVANTAANRRYTFAVREQGSVWRHQAKGLAAFGVALGVTSGALWLLHGLAPAAGRGLELAVLVVANLVATAMRFLLLRHWVFRRRPAAATRPSTPTATTSRSLA
jgi:putative flippase GtrA